MKLVMFSKHLAPLSIEEAGETVRNLGLDGLDLTVRPGGHVLPEAAAGDLPRAVAALRAQGVAVPMITTGIISASQPGAAPTFAAAAEAGVRRLKLGYWPYLPFGTLREQLDQARRELDGLERLAEEHGVCACIHTHSGNYLSATSAGMHLLLEGRDPERIGAYLDPGHMTVEGGAGGWRQGLDLLQGSVRLIAVKDFGWTREERGPGEKPHWRAQLVPLEEGFVPWPEVFACLRQIGFDGTVTLHSEYQGSHSWRDLSLAELLDQTRRDLAYLRPVLAAAGY
jgi:sugar phosphate isomerase/epimerase